MSVWRVRVRVERERMSGGKRGLIFFFTDRVSLTPNFLSLYEQVPARRRGKCDRVVLERVKG